MGHAGLAKDASLTTWPIKWLGHEPFYASKTEREAESKISKEVAMERVTKASLVLVLVVAALLAGAEGGRDFPSKDEVYNTQHFLGLGLGWPFLHPWFGWPFLPFFGFHKAAGLKDMAAKTEPRRGGATMGYDGAGAATYP